MRRPGLSPIRCRGAMHNRAMRLAESTVAAVEARVRALEQATGAQVVVALVERCDAYHGLRWRAFAFGASLAALALVAADLARPAWGSAYAALAHALVILGVGATLAAAAHAFPPVARLFLERDRAEAEVRQYAQALFLERELFATRERNAILLLASRYERAIAVWPDAAYRDRIRAPEWRRVIDAMLAPMRAGRAGDALLAGLDALQALLADKGCRFTAGGANAFPDRPLEERGAP